MPVYGYSPPPRKSHARAVVVIIIAVVVIILLVVFLAFSGVGGYLSAAPAPPVSIQGLNIQFSYTGTTNGYFNNQYSTVSCPTSATPGSTINCQVNLYSSATIFSHDVDDFGASTPFTYESSTPPLPYSMSPGQSATFTVNVGIPSTTGTYTLTITVTTN